MGLDGVELVIRTEEMFGIKISDEEAVKTVTVGDLYDLVLSKLDLPFSDRCLTSFLFYKLRRSIVKLFECNRGDVTPKTSTAKVFPEKKRRELWQRTEEDLGLRLPSLIYKTSFHAILSISFLVLVMFLIWLRSAGAFPNINIVYIVLGAFLVIVSAHLGLSMFRVGLPHGADTIGGLTKLILAGNLAQIRSEIKSLNKKEAYELIQAIIVEQLGVNPEEVVPEASFVRDLGLS